MFMRQWTDDFYMHLPTQVIEGDIHTGHTIEKLCGIREDTLVTDNYVTLRFVTDNTITMKGFHIHYGGKLSMITCWCEIFFRSPVPLREESTVTSGGVAWQSASIEELWCLLCC